MEKKSNVLFDKLKNVKFSSKVKFLIIALVIVVLFSVFFLNFSSENKVKKTQKNNVSGNSLYMSYIAETESRLINVLNAVKDLSNVKVFLNITQSPKITYLTEEKISNSSSSSALVTNTIVLAKDGTLTYPIVVLEELPKVKGILIVAKGAGNPRKKIEITNVVAAILDVDVSCVEVLEGS